MKNKKLILIELNEINFDNIKFYCEKYNLKNLKKILEFNNINTFSENKYDLLEPWIQWTSVHTGLKAEDHKIYHLGDIHNLKSNQIFEEVEKLGYSVGAVSPMNTLNRLDNPKYFIPDPWTNTETDKNILSKKINDILSKTVKENSSFQLSFGMIFKLLYVFFSVVRIRKYFLFLKIFLHSLKKKWFRVIFLDLLINEIHLKYFKKFEPNFSTVFFNGGAHIQHHYFLSSKAIESKKKNPEWYINNNDDPLRDIIVYYDIILSEYIDLKNFDLIVATGLRQVPIKKPEYYWKLKDYKKFLNFFEISFDNIQQLMSRDFIIHYDENNQPEINKSYNILNNIFIINQDNKKFKAFDIIEKREKSIFVSLTFSHDIEEADQFLLEGKNKTLKCLNNVNFVAIKNGIHDSKGYLFTNLNDSILTETIHVMKIYELITNYFKGINENTKI